MKLFIAIFTYTSILLTGLNAEANCRDFLVQKANQLLDGFQSTESLKEIKAKLRMRYQAATQQIGLTEDKKEIETLIAQVHQDQIRYANLHNRIVEREGGYKILPMHIDFIGEQSAKSCFQRNREKSPVFYYSDERLQSVKVSFKNGRAFYPNGKMITQSFSSEFIMDENGDIYIIEPYLDKPEGWLKHTSLSHGHPVACAGLITFESNGRISFVHRRSGHYLPSKEFLKQFVDRIESAGIDLSDAFVEWNIRGSIKN